MLRPVFAPPQSSITVLIFVIRFMSKLSLSLNVLQSLKNINRKSMNIRQQLLDCIQNLPDEKLLPLLNLVVSYQSQENTEPIASASWQMSSHAYQDWVSDRNDIYDELFNE